MKTAKPKRTFTGESLHWLTEEKKAALLRDHPSLDVIEVESVKDKSALYECLVRPPDEIAWAESSRRLSNVKEGANDIFGSQSVIADLCIVAAQPELQDELDDEATATPVKVAIGSAIGKLYPVPEAKLKKTLTRA